MESIRIQEINNLIEEVSSLHPETEDSDIFDELGITGDDFHELMEKYTERFQVDMSGYLWYFHANEEGGHFGSVFETSPSQEFKRIPVTPKMLAEFSMKGKWEMDYPPHTTRTSRSDLRLYLIVLLAVVAVLAYVLARTFIED